MVFLRTYIIRTKFSKVFLRAYISHKKSHVYFGYNIQYKEDDVYKSFAHIFVCKLVMNNLDINGLVKDDPDVSNTRREHGVE